MADTTAVDAAALEEVAALAASLTASLPSLDAVTTVLRDALGGGGTVYSFGNGGSAADAMHLTGELIGHYRLDRRPLRAVTLGTDPVVATCIANDYDGTQVFARPVSALARPGDVVVAFSTSGRSPNVVAGLRAARATGATTVLLGGADAGPAAPWADHLLLVPSRSTPRIQEIHTVFLHLISDALDRWAAA